MDLKISVAVDDGKSATAAPIQRLMTDPPLPSPQISTTHGLGPQDLHDQEEAETSPESNDTSSPPQTRRSQTIDSTKTPDVPSK